MKIQNLLSKSLNGIEKVGNKLPHPVTIFLILTLLIVVVSVLLEMLGVSCSFSRINIADKVEDKVTVHAVSLLNREGIQFMLEKMVSNFTSFAPLGTVLVIMLGIGVAEGSGMINTLLKKAVSITPQRFLTASIVFLGVMSSVASDAGYVVLIPLGAVIFKSFGRHPLAGLVAAFAGVSGGFSANLSIGGIDALLGGITQEAARIMNPEALVYATGNYYFMCASTFLITVIGTWVTEKVVEPRLNKTLPYDNSSSEKTTEITTHLTSDERRGLIFALVTFLISVTILLANLLPENAILRSAEGQILGQSPFMLGLIAIIFLLFLLPSIAYGIGAKTIRSDRDLEQFMSKTMASMGTYIVLSFFAAQFIAYFNYSNLGVILAVHGANFLKLIHLGGLPLIIGFVILAAFINIFVGSASAKWAIMAPIFVPLMMQLGYTPELAQLAYRIGDSVTNIISPLMAYFVIIIAFAQLYVKEIKMGTLIAVMSPYSLALLVGWILLLAIWYLFGLPIGPDVYMLSSPLPVP